MKWVKLTILEAQEVQDNISTDETADNAYNLLEAAIGNAVEEEISGNDPDLVNR